MMRYATLLLFVLMLGGTMQNAVAAESCEASKIACVNFGKDTSQYKNCVEKSCAVKVPSGKKTTKEVKSDTPTPAASDTTEKKADSKDNTKNKDTTSVGNQEQKTCDIGLRRCDALRGENLLYWSCMNDTCADPELSKKNPVCEEGQKQCLDSYKEYLTCVSLICKNPAGKFKTCEAGETACPEPLRRYWHCMSRTCIANIQEYLDPLKYSRTTGQPIQSTMTPGPDGKMRPVISDLNPTVLLGVPKVFRYAPPGIDPQEWVSSPPPERLISGSPGDKVECPLGMTVSCSSRDIMDCYCSDGTRALPKEAKAAETEKPEEDPTPFLNAYPKGVRQAIEENMRRDRQKEQQKK